MLYLNTHDQMGVLTHTYNPSTGETKAGESQILGQNKLHIKILPHKTKYNWSQGNDLADKGACHQA